HAIAHRDGQRNATLIGRDKLRAFTGVLLGTRVLLRAFEDSEELVRAERMVGVAGSHVTLRQAFFLGHPLTGIARLDLFEVPAVRLAEGLDALLEDGVEPGHATAAPA